MRAPEMLYTEAAMWGFVKTAQVLGAALDFVVSAVP